MKKTLLIIGIIAMAINARAQKLELSVQANTGMFRYSGISATDESIVVYALKPEESYTNNPYGNKNAVIFGGGLKASLITKHGFLFGAQVDYEELKSKVLLYEYPYFASSSSVFVVSGSGTESIVGKTYLVSHFINISPYIGYRFNCKKVSVDVLPGLDIGLGINRYEDGRVDNTNYKLSRKREDPPTDIRLRIGTAVSYQRLSLNASYAKGLTNYMNGMVGGGPYNAKSQLFHFGLGYRLY